MCACVELPQINLWINDVIIYSCWCDQGFSVRFFRQIMVIIIQTFFCWSDIVVTKVLWIGYCNKLRINTKELLFLLISILRFSIMSFFSLNFQQCHIVINSVFKQFRISFETQRIWGSFFWGSYLFLPQINNLRSFDFQSFLSKVQVNDIKRLFDLITQVLVSSLY